MPGQYAVRGGILDVYSPEAERPVRIEFFGDEVDSIRRFDPTSQRSSNPIDEALLLPLDGDSGQRSACWARFIRGSRASASPGMTRKWSKRPFDPAG